MEFCNHPGQYFSLAKGHDGTLSCFYLVIPRCRDAIGKQFWDGHGQHQFREKCVVVTLLIENFHRAKSRNLMRRRKVNDE